MDKNVYVQITVGLEVAFDSHAIRFVEIYVQITFDSRLFALNYGSSHFCLEIYK